jgi:HEPN domain-containing protein
MKKLTREWVQKAEADRIIARLAAASARPPKDAICFHCQQVAEKYLKALLQELGLPIERTHDLLDLLSDLSPHFPGLPSLRRGLDFLTRFAVDVRYPGFHARKRQADSSLRWAERVRDACRLLLGIRTRRPRRKKSP